MAICKNFGYPDLFLTITCNPNWPEFRRFTERERIPIADCPDIFSRVFHAKLKCLLSDLKKGVFFGPLSAVCILLSSKKRGLPHAHMLLWLNGENNLQNLTMSQDELQTFCLLEIEKLLQSNGKSLRNYDGMPVPNDSLVSQFSNLMLLRELQYDTVSLTREHDTNILKLNEQQRVVYDRIIDCVSNKRHRFFFVYGMNMIPSDTVIPFKFQCR
ncbi:hypothetical protein Ahy_A03g014979 isoform A [Arachis hypogaea]|uniref:Helitron helicase-like domain-containing protein n=1 Tax=Arachis hypogaea TaxID=3818 RepID=A0A445DZB2_ARAHY|nr:hypothetical protein Ahy_A03g014979 isoform A [Arachis hypogaea]